MPVWFFDFLNNIFKVFFKAIVKLIVILPMCLLEVLGVVIYLLPYIIINIYIYYICMSTNVRYWQNLVKSMGRSLQVQIVNCLSILSLESSMDAQNKWFMHTIKVFVLQKFTVVVFFIFFKTWKCDCKWKMALNVGHFSVMFMITKNKQFQNA